MSATFEVNSIQLSSLTKNILISINVLFLRHFFRYLKQEILVNVTFDNETICAMWRQLVVTYCLHPLIGDDQSYEYDDDTDPILTDPSLLMDSNYESINWYPLTGLLAVPAFVGIVCFVVLRRRFVKN